jgi:hypothetical protein
MNKELTIEDFLSTIANDSSQKGGVLQVPPVLVSGTREGPIAASALSYLGKQKAHYSYNVPADGDSQSEDAELIARIETWCAEHKLAFSRAQRTFTFAPIKKTYSAKTVVAALALEGAHAEMLNAVNGTLKHSEVYAVARGAGLTDAQTTERLAHYQAQ